MVLWRDVFVNVEKIGRSFGERTHTMAKKARRTTHRSSKGTKLYAVRDSSGQFKDIQTYKRAHSADLRRTSKAETAAAAKKAAKKVSKKSAATSAKKTVKKATKTSAAKAVRKSVKTVVRKSVKKIARKGAKKR